MATTDEQPAAAAEAVVEEAAPAPEVPRKRGKAPTRPDEETHKSQVEALQKSIDKSKKRGEELRQLMAAQREGQGQGSEEIAEVRAKLGELRSRFTQLLEKRRGVRDQLDAATKARDAARASLRDMKSSMRFTSVEAIEGRIAELEQRQAHGSLTLAEEKRVVGEIRALERSKVNVAELTAQMTQLEADDGARDDLQAKAKQATEELTAVRAQEDEWKAKLAELQAAAREKGSKYPEWKEELAKCRDASKAAYERIKELRAENDARWETYKKENAEYRAWMQEERKRQFEERQAERARRDAERAQHAAENAPEPFDREITMADQLIKALDKTTTTSGSGTKGSEVKAPKNAPKILDGGLKQLQKGKVKGGDAWMLGAKKAAAPKQKRAGTTAEAKPSGEKLVLSLDTLEAFGVLAIAVPTTSGDVPTTLEKINAAKELYLKKREEAKAATAAGEPLPSAPSVEQEQKPGRERGKKAGTQNNGRLANLDDEEQWPSMPSVVPAASPVPDISGSEMKLELEVVEDGNVAVTISP